MKIVTFITISDIDAFINYMVNTKGIKKTKILRDLNIYNHYYRQIARGQENFNRKISAKIIEYACNFNFLFTLND